MKQFITYWDFANTLNQQTRDDTANGSGYQSKVIGHIDRKYGKQPADQGRAQKPLACSAMRSK
jgi:hypothetical protein